MADVLKLWNLANDEIGEEIQGQFPAEDVKESGIGGVYTEHHTLSRPRGILQFLHGKTPVVEFTSRYFAVDKDDTVHRIWLQLKEWSQVNPDFGRPPLLQFWIGDAHINLKQCVLEDIGDITYEEPRDDGSLRHVIFSIRLREYTPYNLEEASSGETRYHTSKQADYYEMLCLREYGDPMLGDVIRKRHPSKPMILVGDVIRLPSHAALRKEVVQPKSIALGGAFAKKDNPSRTLRIQIFEARNRIATSHVLKEY